MQVGLWRIVNLMNITKNEIRKNLLSQRSLLTSQEIKEYSKIICAEIKKLEQFKQAKVIFTYVSTKNEVSTYSLMQDSINEGKEVCVPLSIKDSRELSFYRIFDLRKDLTTGNYGIPEPVPDSARAALQHQAEIIIVPGVVFDLNLNRIGHGKGYYDSFLSGISKEIPKIALAYDFQVLEDIPTERNDIKMDMIITEKRIIKAKTRC